MRTYSNWYAAYECMIDGNLVIADTLHIGVDGSIQLTLGDDIVAMAASTATFVRICKVENCDTDETTGQATQN